MSRVGLFIGLVTLDLIYLVEQLPASNQKIVAINYTAAAGGPATNAAVTFRHLGNSATLLGVVGAHPINHLILADLQQCGVAISDLDPTRCESPPVSSIVVTQSTGERAVVSINAGKSQVKQTAISANILQDVAIVLIDGHQMQVGAAIAQQAKQQGIPVVIDAGSWKAGFDRVLPFVDYAICSANFHPPAGLAYGQTSYQSADHVFTYLSNFGIPHIAITQGQKPIELLSNGKRGQIEVPIVQVIDTLGAGDIFHGAFCHYILQSNFEIALARSGEIAAYACQFFGTRQWMANDR